MIFLFITRTNWDEPPRARHQLARSLAKTHNVIFVCLNTTGKPGISITNPEKNITLISPSWWINGKITMRIPIINELYQNWLFKILMSRYRNCHVINFDVTAASLDRYFKNFVYYCGDNFLTTNRSKSRFVSLYWYLTQKMVAQKADFCTGVSKFIQKKLAQYNKKSYLLLTGAIPVPLTDVISAENKNEEKNIVYVGWLTKLNIHWVTELSNNRNYRIFLIGPFIKKHVKYFKGIDNIKITGEKTGDELNPYLIPADVCIAPYINSKDTEEVYTMPNKFWLYLSFGKPIVTLRIRNLTDLPDKFVYQSKDLPEFIANVEKAILDNSQVFSEKRIDFIQNNTWDYRVKELLRLYKANNLT